MVWDAVVAAVVGGAVVCVVVVVRFLLPLVIGVS